MPPADFQLLFGDSRWANADQMYGFSAECGLKAVMKKLGMQVDVTTGTPAQDAHRKHSVAPHQAAARTVLNMVQSAAQAGLL